MDYQKKLKIYNKAKKIISSDLEWEDKYDLIFSDKISKKVRFYYCDPDTSYQEDVEAFTRGFDDYMKKEKMISEQFDEIKKRDVWNDLFEIFAEKFKSIQDGGIYINVNKKAVIKELKKQFNLKRKK